LEKLKTKRISKAINHYFIKGKRWQLKYANSGGLNRCKMLAAAVGVPSKIEASQGHIVAVLGNCWNNRRYAFSGGFVAICGGFLLKFEK
jgi:hypothetical protein